MAEPTTTINDEENTFVDVCGDDDCENNKENIEGQLAWKTNTLKAQSPIKGTTNNNDQNALHSMRTTSTTVKTEMPSSSLADSSSITIYGTNTSHPQFASSLLLINDGSSTTFGSEQPHCRMATNIENANDENSNNKEEEVDEQKEGEEMRSGEQPQQQRLRVSRKEKSLRIYLCPFRQRVEMEAAQGKDIHLETVARSMCVEKRRIYDIVNVMEALEMMEKTNKSFYKWHGDTHLPMLMHKLRSEAHLRELPSRIATLQRAMCSFANIGINTSSSNPIAASVAGSPVAEIAAENGGNADGCLTKQSETLDGEGGGGLDGGEDQAFGQIVGRGERCGKNSLAQLCRRFLMVLLCGQQGHRISLDVVSTMLIKDFDSGDHEPPSRSRCRRLYDISNVLREMGLIKKSDFPFGTKKIPLYEYNGPEPDGEPRNADLRMREFRQRTEQTQQQQHHMMTFPAAARSSLSFKLESPDRGGQKDVGEIQQQQQQQKRNRKRKRQVDKSMEEKEGQQPAAAASASTPDCTATNSSSVCSTKLIEDVPLEDPKQVQQNVSLPKAKKQRRVLGELNGSQSRRAIKAEDEEQHKLLNNNNKIHGVEQQQHKAALLLPRPRPMFPSAELASFLGSAIPLEPSPSVAAGSTIPCAPSPSMPLFQPAQMAANAVAAVAAAAIKASFCSPPSQMPPPPPGADAAFRSSSSISTSASSASSSAFCLPANSSAAQLAALAAATERLLSQHLFAGYHSSSSTTTTAAARQQQHQTTMPPPLPNPIQFASAAASILSNGNFVPAKSASPPPPRRSFPLSTVNGTKVRHSVQSILGVSQRENIAAGLANQQNSNPKFESPKAFKPFHQQQQQNMPKSMGTTAAKKALPFTQRQCYY